MRIHNKINEIKYLIPDYVLGVLNESDRRKVEEAISSSSELKEFAEEIRAAFRAASSIKFEEPLPQYWNNLLPRIHERMEREGSKRKLRDFSKSFGLAWKVLVPVAAIVLFFIIFRIITRETPVQYTQKDTTTVIQKENLNSNSKKEVQKQDESLANKENSTINEEKAPVITAKRKGMHMEIKPLENQEKVNSSNEQEVGPAEKNENEDLAMTDIDEIEYAASGYDNSNEEEMETELNNLDNIQKEELLQKLSKSNL